MHTRQQKQCLFIVLIHAKELNIVLLLFYMLANKRIHFKPSGNVRTARRA